MTPRLTTANADLNRLIKQTPAGMMHWSGTAADPHATCGRCQHYRYQIDLRDFAGNTLATQAYPGRCERFYKYTQRHGDKLPPATRACKYFAPKNGGDNQ